jgi:hypothetical protein
MYPHRLILLQVVKDERSGDDDGQSSSGLPIYMTILTAIFSPVTSTRSLIDETAAHKVTNRCLRRVFGFICHLWKMWTKGTSDDRILKSSERQLPIIGLDERHRDQHLLTTL